MRSATLLAALAAGSFLLLLPVAAAASLDARDDQNQPRYEPYDVTARPGEQVTLRDAGQEPHTMTSVDGAWSAISVDAGQSANLTAPAQPGDYRFYCAYHAGPQTQPGQGMAGVLHVTASPSPPPPPPGGKSQATPLGVQPLLLALAGAALLLRRR